MARIIIYTSLFIILTIGISSLYIFQEFGKNPSKEEYRAYKKLSYFKNGEFQSPEELIYDFNNVRNGPTSWSRFLRKSRFAPTEAMPKIMLNKASFSKSPDDFALFWLGHSAAILELDGKRMIFDPVLGNAGPLPFITPRYDEAPIKRADLPELDYIIITHNHYDHLERKTVQSIKTGHFIIPLGIKAALTGWGIDESRITELGWNESFEKDGFKITATEGVHYSSRSPWNRNKTLWNSYVIKSPSMQIFWGGDTGYGEHFKHLGKKHGSFDFAALEIDGWNTGWKNTHLFPHEVIKAAKDINVKNILPIHWAVFDLALHPWHESIDMVIDEAKDTQINILTPKMGEKINLNSQTNHWWK